MEKGFTYEDLISGTVETYRILEPMHDLIDRAAGQNFVPVVDDKDAFIGIITRKAIIKYCQQRLFPEA